MFSTDSKVHTWSYTYVKTILVEIRTFELSSEHRQSSRIAQFQIMVSSAARVFDVTCHAHLKNGLAL